MLGNARNLNTPIDFLLFIDDNGLLFFIVFEPSDQCSLSLVFQSVSIVQFFHEYSSSSCFVYSIRSSQRYLLDCTLCTGEMRWLDERALDGDDAIGRRKGSYFFQEEEHENTQITGIDRGNSAAQYTFVLILMRSCSGWNGAVKMPQLRKQKGNVIMNEKQHIVYAYRHTSRHRYREPNILSNP